jgi:hypothetical protein
LFHQGVVDLPPEFEPDPEKEMCREKLPPATFRAVVAVDRLPVGKIDGECSPFDAIVSPIEDGIEYGSQINFTLFADRFCRRKERMNLLPFSIIEVTGGRS